MQFIRKLALFQPLRRAHFSHLLKAWTLLCILGGSAYAQTTVRLWDRLSTDQRMQLVGAEMAFANSALRMAELIADAAKDSGQKICIAPTLRKERLRIYIALGYQNGNWSITEDLSMHEAIQNLLTKDCTDFGHEAMLQICDFSESLENKNILAKQLRRADGSKARVEIEIATSSYSPYDYDNQNAFKVRQQQKSKNARDNFHSALNTHDVVFYVGHSRDGGGPDFFPPRLLPEYAQKRVVPGDQVDYSYYADSPHGLLDLLHHLKISQTSPAVLGLFSCDSASHFYRRISRVMPNNTLLFSTTRVTDQTMEALLLGLNGVLTEQCDSAIDVMLAPYDGRTQRTRRP